MKITAEQARELLAKPKSSKYRNKPVWECQECDMVYYKRPHFKKPGRKKHPTVCDRCGATEVWDFDSTKEHKRWHELKLLEKTGQIRFLERQVEFTFEIIRLNDAGNTIKELLKHDSGKPVKYKTDHVYDDLRNLRDELQKVNGPLSESGFQKWLSERPQYFSKVVEDVKSAGTRTEAYKIKKALMRTVHGVTVHEV